jgi:hypothetical protein
LRDTGLEPNTLARGWLAPEFAFIPHSEFANNSEGTLSEPPPFLLQVVVVNTPHAVFHLAQMAPFGIYYRPVISVAGSCNAYVFSRPSGEGTGARMTTSRKLARDAAHKAHELFMPPEHFMIERYGK